jgi:hypothetical protein
MTARTGAALLAALCATYAVNGDPERRLARCFDNMMTGDTVEPTSDLTPCGSTVST